MLYLIALSIVKNMVFSCCFLSDFYIVYASDDLLFSYFLFIVSIGLDFKRCTFRSIFLFSLLYQTTKKQTDNDFKKYMYNTCKCWLYQHDILIQCILFNTLREYNHWYVSFLWYRLPLLSGIITYNIWHFLLILCSE